MLNPTPALLDEHGIESVDDMRALMDNRRRAAQTAAVAVTDRPRIGDLIQASHPPETQHTTSDPHPHPHAAQHDPTIAERAPDVEP